MSANPSTPPDTLDRWPGLAAFTEAMRGQFHGRTEMATELLRQVRRDSFSVLFGQSGHGKTSLLRAGLFPLLRQAEFLPVYVRIDHRSPSASPEGQLEAALHAACADAGVTAPPRQAGDTLWEYLHRPEADFWSPTQEWLTPVFIIDQFEEVFTLAQGSNAADRRRAFLDALSDLGGNAIPLALKRRLEADPEIHAAYDLKRLPCKVLICLREDFLADLEALQSSFRSISRSRLRLKGLNGLQALEAVEGPGQGILDAGVAQSIVQFVANAPPATGADGESAEWWQQLQVEPALLSIVCRQLDRRRQEQGLEKISTALLEGSHQEILADFYRKSLEGLPDAVPAFIEEQLLTHSGHRDSRAFEDAIAEPGLTRQDLMQLVDRRLLHLEDRAGTSRIELTHDLLTSVIRRSRDARRSLEETEKTAARERALRHRLRLSRTLAAAFALLFLMAVAAALWALNMRNEARRQEVRAKHSLQEAEKLAAFMTLPLDNMVKSYGRLDALDAVQQKLDEYFAVRAAAGPPTPEGRKQEARYRIIKGEHYIRQGRSEEAEVQFRLAEGGADGIDDPACEMMALRAKTMLADLQTARGLPAEANAMLAAAEGRARELGDLHPQNPEIAEGLAEVLDAAGRSNPDPAAGMLRISMAREVWSGLAEAHPSDSRYAMKAEESLFHIARRQMDLSRMEEARNTLRQCLEIIDARLAIQPDNPLWLREKAVRHHVRGETLNPLTDSARIEPDYQKHDEITRQLLARDAGNADWQREAAIGSLARGHLLQAQKKDREALQFIAEYHRVASQLVIRDPSREQWQEDLAWGEHCLANAHDMLHAQGGGADDAVAALEHYRTERRRCWAILRVNPHNHLLWTRLADTQSAVLNLLKRSQPEGAMMQEARAVVGEVLAPENAKLREAAVPRVRDVFEALVQTRALRSPQELAELTDMLTQQAGTAPTGEK
ncbi:MAG: hypothetical protein KA004_18065 [Verrucomicrobiales bacterium]|nr:hypothetical protein [Verrucomicrobiales bacterium]